MTRALPLLLIVALLAAPTPAGAVPAPLSAAELVARSDLVAVVRVLSVSCVAVATDPRTGETLRRFAAQLLLLAVEKGRERAGETVMVQWEEIPRGVVGPWSVGYLLGEEVKTHLAGSRETGYGTTWWNARGDRQRPPDRPDLPTAAGQSFIISDGARRRLPWMRRLRRLLRG